jgi:type III pantothenate kinase
MSILLVDIGNTRVKWARLIGTEIGTAQAAAHADHNQNPSKELLQGDVPERILIANVAGTEIGQLLRAGLAKTYGVEPEFVRTVATAAGVRNAYPVPQQLGVDRWLAMIAAYRLERQAVCVVNAGTAMTVDGVDALGNHLGGVILPGPELMVSSLFVNTADIAAHAALSPDVDTQSVLFARNTHAAVRQGAAHALAAVIERACLEMQATGHRPVLIVDGGGASRIAHALRVPFRPVPDLVLRGLAVLAQTEGL